jgi:hypothetical protein
MSRKDYIIIAQALIDARKYEGDAGGDISVLEGISVATSFISNALKQDNPRFDQEHFDSVVRGDKALMSRPKLEAKL